MSVSNKPVTRNAVAVKAVNKKVAGVMSVALACTMLVSGLPCCGPHLFQSNDGYLTYGCRDKH